MQRNTVMPNITVKFNFWSATTLITTQLLAIEIRNFPMFCILWIRISELRKGKLYSDYEAVNELTIYHSFNDNCQLFPVWTR